MDRILYREMWTSHGTKVKFVAIIEEIAIARAAIYEHVSVMHHALVISSFDRTRATLFHYRPYSSSFDCVGCMCCVMCGCGQLCGLVHDDELGTYQSRIYKIHPCTGHLLYCHQTPTY